MTVIVSADSDDNQTGRRSAVTDGAGRRMMNGCNHISDAARGLTKITSHADQTDDPDDTTDIENQIVYTYGDLSQAT
ncbi:MAG: hypothetical protein AB7V46_18380 [Thermomicrobiales bacterium]